jgi:hypothetical protein
MIRAEMLKEKETEDKLKVDFEIRWRMRDTNSMKKQTISK